MLPYNATDMVNAITLDIARARRRHPWMVAAATSRTSLSHRVTSYLSRRLVRNEKGTAQAA